ncbi:GT2 family glycosyltransferase [Desulfofundulus luciae]|uniref:GT2 family glycosyltransferase n=1 Tax=Desulfofundulus luciae TaxID=74702 RepID=A0ABU0AWV7_9FIRM|nr:glycosyltransferase family 2 protein [Desulfofundulus luciae]MDQ0284960.1 GT2 family glycosyltransferase [Desulfofundulus luciae]
MLVSIIIAVHNQLEHIQNCLRALWKNTSRVFPWELIIVDNNSDKQTAAWLKTLGGEVRLVSNSINLGFVHACNQGAAASRGKYLLFLNSDTRPLPGWLTALVAALQENPRAGAAGARLLYPDGRLQEAGAIIWRDGTGWNYGRGDNPALPKYNYPRPVDYCSGACLMVRADLFRVLGGFDPRYAPMYYEDADLCFGLRQAGWAVLYVPGAAVIHYDGGTAAAGNGGWRHYMAVNREKFVAKWKDVLRYHYPPSPENVERACCRPLDA